MKKFIVLYKAPVKQLEEWSKTPVEDRKPQEEKMRGEWQTWTAVHRSQVTETFGAGATKRVTTGGIADVKNDVMLYSIVEAEDHESAAAMFTNHPHLGIPDASIEVMPSNLLPGMQGM